MKSTLDELCIKHGCDKATVHETAHGYAPFYESFFFPLIDKPIKLLEIGVGAGPSMQVWLEYFPEATVVGIDKVHDTNPWNTPGHKPNPRYSFCSGDQTDRTFWKCFAADYGKDWDVIIDDGGHFNDQIIISYEGLWPILKSGGLYCVEDLGVSYGGASIFVRPGYPNHMDWLRKLIDKMNTGNDIASMHFHKELAIMRKL